MRRNIPLARQVILEILSAIATGGMAGPNGQIPSEAELSQRFGVSRSTIREALTTLELAGLVMRRQGAGTFVNPKFNGHPEGIYGWFDEAGAFMDMIRGSHREASCEVLQTGVQAAGKLASPLEMDTAAPVVYIEKRLFSSATPVIHCVNYVPLHLVDPDLADQAAFLFRQAETSYRFLDACCQRSVHHQQSEISAIAADESLARWLECQVGAPLLCVEEVGYADDMTPVFYGLNHFRGDIVRFRQLRRTSVDITATVSLGDGDSARSTPSP